MHLTTDQKVAGLNPAGVTKKPILTGWLFALGAVIELNKTGVWSVVELISQESPENKSLTTLKKYGAFQFAHNLHTVFVDQAKLLGISFLGINICQYNHEKRSPKAPSISIITQRKLLLQTSH